MANEKDTMNLPQKSSNPDAPAGPSTQPGRGVTSKPTGPEYPDLPPAHTRETPRKVMDDQDGSRTGGSSPAGSGPGTASHQNKAGLGGQSEGQNQGSSGVPKSSASSGTTGPTGKN